MPSQVKELQPARVLLVDGDGRTRNVLARVLEGQNHVAHVADNVRAAVRELARQPYDVVLFDLDGIGLDGLHALSNAESRERSAQFIALAEPDSVEEAIEATKRGAFGYITKPFDSDELLSLVERTRREAERRRTHVSQRQQRLHAVQSSIVGNSAPMRALFDQMEHVAGTRATVLIVGDTGTGKELVARGIHELSERANGPFIPINCAALPESLLESELFGHARGSFTGAIANRTGLFEEANGGTLFLDEVSTISPAIQVKLLRVLQEHKIQRVGGGPLIASDFRLIVATNVDLAGEVAANRFREDLFYRLNVVPIRVPPLRERADDIPLLAQHFRLKFSRENGVTAPILSPETLERLVGYDWPGNVRELENFMERAVILYAGKSNVPFDPPLGERAEQQRALLQLARANQWDLARLEREYILDVLESQGGRRSDAAVILGIDRRTLYRKLKEFGLNSPRTTRAS